MSGRNHRGGRGGGRGRGRGRGPEPSTPKKPKEPKTVDEYFFYVGSSKQASDYSTW